MGPPSLRTDLTCCAVLVRPTGDTAGACRCAVRPSVGAVLPEPAPSACTCQTTRAADCPPLSCTNYTCIPTSLSRSWRWPSFWQRVLLPRWRRHPFRRRTPRVVRTSSRKLARPGPQGRCSRRDKRPTPRATSHRRATRTTIPLTTATTSITRTRLQRTRTRCPRTRRQPGWKSPKSSANKCEGVTPARAL